uniref:Uncharacterized protein n=1 Tax=Anguilla anguilla TaxID=7936 RepID=A0A0E9T9G3_ANGAN
MRLALKLTPLPELPGNLDLIVYVCM